MYIATIKLGTMIHLLLNNNKYSVLGWTKNKIPYTTSKSKIRCKRFYCGTKSQTIQKNIIY
jgi:hypothetical protein